jgi:transposase-like protein
LPGPQRSDGERSEAERSGGPGNADRGGTAGPAHGAQHISDPEVLDRPRRRRFTAKYKRRVLRQADSCAHGEVAALLRREGLYSSHLTAWRKERDLGELEALAPKKRGPKSTQDPKLVAEIQQLRRENQRLARRLRQAETVIDVQKKVSELLGIPLNTPENDEYA